MTMHVHILGIAGTFMGGIAQLARAMGMRVSGSDRDVYPPMSTQLEAAGIDITQGYEAAQLDPPPDLVVIGNALSRGNPAVEYVLERGLAYTSGPEFLRHYVLKDRWVLAVAGTHGKTTTASMLAWILEQAGMAPGFLIGGVPQGFGLSARLGETPFFVVEADEYDTAFFDKRSKFVHYRPRTVILNNLEFDHADIFDSLADIQRQFHHLVRTVPANGLIVRPQDDQALADVIGMGCWTAQERLNGEPGDDGGHADWWLEDASEDGGAFSVNNRQGQTARVDWQLQGRHNIHNALAALAAARHVGVTPEIAARALSEFPGVKRRMELRGEADGIYVYDDFAHHPTAIATTLEGARKHLLHNGNGRLLAILEPRSNTMRMGHHAQELPASLAAADDVYLFEPAGLDWSLEDLAKSIKPAHRVYNDVEAIVADVAEGAKTGDRIVVMSNGGFGGIHEKLLSALRARQ